MVPSLYVYLIVCVHERVSAIPPLSPSLQNGERETSYSKWRLPLALADRCNMPVPVARDHCKPRPATPNRPTSLRSRPPHTVFVLTHPCQTLPKQQTSKESKKYSERERGRAAAILHQPSPFVSLILHWSSWQTSSIVQPRSNEKLPSLMKQVCLYTL